MTSTTRQELEDHKELALDTRRRIVHFLREDGYTVLELDNNPTVQWKNGLPHKILFPDLDVMKVGKRLWVATFFKSHADRDKRTLKKVHGINLRHYKDYLRVQALSGTKVWIYLYEQESHRILRRSLDALSNHIDHFYTGSKMGAGGMIFFPRRAFRLYRSYA